MDPVLAVVVGVLLGLVVGVAGWWATVWSVARSRCPSCGAEREPKS